MSAFSRSAFIAAIAAAACACGRGDENSRKPVANQAAGLPATKTAAPGKPREESIMRPDVLAETTQSERPKLEPIRITLDFSDAHREVPDPAKKALDLLLQRPLLEKGGCIVVRGHTDSRGSDKDNLIVSERRAKLVADYLTGHGVDANRVRVMALGERRPVAPNANLDGTDNPEGRAKNRRVTVDAEIPRSAFCHANPSSNSNEQSSGSVD